ncbi:N-acetyl-gamma-glutamyl-phosphate reductase [Burkholderia glumae]|uniref:N-acetyl-gamma-glutamyl-phosphate reductase n=1 Tax=Burkholderia glumae TaxID=337 RepID=A0AAP9XVE4_BURGL|nr:N-acetyl-gamma-glutamyl-phosphate reductase [Burkholderia glumae]ACR31809.1 N-acetyl-gamma-glutamyl-phosphate reductase [Burkholderia glumae BGR1]AJY64317.1 N-acetyl-gamma-glutamyl-phosphate reductase [Burkholderia glumae LMG 2196 = ATCC 33617]KHJ64781.1 N-acetyl-gamma-glutamyl-phosphate reductase [Burkholderia glumae]MCM2485013.1 N-acetyl-gamma-glutamyl-phosphate reductase [Burkholderia glumae]MCM2495367.1 N-acetyl-gamma-glutamyl-phosphate reductase [Burkholderia glumae]
MSEPIVFIDGDQGTTGLQIHERLRGRADLRLATLAADARKDPARRAEAINACDVAILCLPDAAAREAVGFIRNPAVRVIDASSAHRTDPAWVYGFPEMTPGQAARIAGARRVTNPGCYPTGAIGLLRPLIEHRLLPADYPVAIHAVSGYSGGGRAAVEAHQAPGGAAPAFCLYGLGLAHKHPPEIREHAGLAHRPLFVPAYAAYRQGIVLSVPLERRLLPAGVDGARLQGCLARHYAGAPHVRVLPLAASREIAQLDPQALNGTDDIEFGVFVNDDYGHLLLTAVFDNLGKGAAGAAVQNLELMLPALR